MTDTRKKEDRIHVKGLSFDGNDRAIFIAAYASAFTTLMLRPYREGLDDCAKEAREAARLAVAHLGHTS